VDAAFALQWVCGGTVVRKRPAHPAYPNLCFRVLRPHPV